MPAPLYVQIWHDGQCLQEVPFTGDRMQIGRLPENDVVLNHLSVSRIHAQLERDGSEVMVEDLGSQNGVWLGEERIAGRAIAPFEESIRIGQHEIRLRRESEADDAEFPVPVPATLDGPTGTAGDLVGERPLPPVVRPGTSPEPPSASELPESRAVLNGEGGLDDLSPFAIDEDEIADDASLPDGVAELSAEELFDVDDDPTSLVDYPSEEVSAAEDAQEDLHPGLIIQQSGQIDRVIVWDREELVAGRGSRCQILLQAPEVSRRHARFVREGDRYEVRDLGSINGIFVNDTRVNHHDLQVGDVVRIDAFEITFVLDPQPIADGVQVAEAELLDASGTDQQHPTRMAGDRSREEAAWDGAERSELPEVEAEPSRSPADESEAAGDDEPEGLLMADDLGLDEPAEPADLEDLEDLEETPFGEPDEELQDVAGLEPDPVSPDPLATEEDGGGPEAPADVAVGDPAELPAVDLLDASLDEDDDLEKDEPAGLLSTLELEISVESLPEELRRALAVLEDETITVPVRLRLRR